MAVDVIDFNLFALVAILVVASIAMLFAILAFAAARRAQGALTYDEARALLREEGDLSRDALDASARGLRQELGGMLGQTHAGIERAMALLSDSLLQRIDGFGLRLQQMGATAETQAGSLRALTENRFDQFAAAQADSARGLRDELNASFLRMRQGVAETLREASDIQKERLDATQRDLKALAESQKQAGETLRLTVEGRLDVIRQENAVKLDEVRKTVDDKLNDTLNRRLDESFGRVVEQLNRAYEAFGEMRSISAQVGDLKNVLTNPKLRGTFGEVQLAMLLQDFLSPGQYIKDVQVKDGSAERVEYAVRIPMGEGEEMLLPIDAKFPREDHEHMIAALEKGDVALAEHFRKQLETRLKSFAKDIARKYINAPRTTERAILFLPTESLFAEALRMPGLFETLSRDCNVMLAGPTTFSAMLHAFQINHRSMALAAKSAEVWKVLSAVRTEFGKYNEVVGKVGAQINRAANSFDEFKTRANQMNRALKNVDVLSDDSAAAHVLGLDPPSQRTDADFEAEAELEATQNVATLAGRVAFAS